MLKNIQQKISSDSAYVTGLVSRVFNVSSVDYLQNSAELKRELQSLRDLEKCKKQVCMNRWSNEFADIASMLTVVDELSVGNWYISDAKSNFSAAASEGKYNVSEAKAIMPTISIGIHFERQRGAGNEGIFCVVPFLTNSGISILAFQFLFWYFDSGISIPVF